MSPRRQRTWSTSCASTTSQSSTASIYPTPPPPSEPTHAITNVYGSFTTTPPAVLWLRAHLRLQIPCPDPPLSSAHSRSPSISRTLLTDFDSPPTSPSTDLDDNPPRLHPALQAVENASRLSRKTTCSTCSKTGTNFPRCPRCHEMWCSRACRLDGGKKKHACAIRKV